jgi:hypothetical protein
MWTKRTLAVLVIIMGTIVTTGLGCSENAAATAKCKTENKDSDTCSKCCTSNGASGYKYVGNDCACLGGG